jgi:ubiquitin-protein ligase
MFELRDLSKSLPIYYESSILLYVNEQNIKLMRCIIIGPEKTPYENGWFEFDLMCEDYPNRPPHVTYLTRYPGQDNHNVNDDYKFNPNIYSDGAICLSLLGTFGSKSSAEAWNPELSTILQVLLSLQTSLFVEKPFYNEAPNHQTYGTSHGEELSLKMNERIRFLVMSVAILGQLRRKDYFLSDVMKTHFKYKKEVILKICQQWVQEAGDKHKSKMEKIYNDIKKELENL